VDVVPPLDSPVSPPVGVEIEPPFGKPPFDGSPPNPPADGSVVGNPPVSTLGEPPFDTPPLATPPFENAPVPISPVIRSPPSATPSTPIAVAQPLAATATNREMNKRVRMLVSCHRRRPINRATLVSVTAELDFTALEATD
jgi:hypothetical protein